MDSYYIPDLVELRNDLSRCNTLASKVGHILQDKDRQIADLQRQLTDQIADKQRILDLYETALATKRAEICRLVDEACQCNNALVRQKGVIIKLINSGCLTSARHYLENVKDLWEAVGCGSKHKELMEKLKGIKE